MTSMDKLIEEIEHNNKYSKQILKEISSIGEENAEYFTNSNIKPRKVEEKTKHTNKNSKFKTDGKTGLFADSIRKILEAEQKARNEQYDLTKELQPILQKFQETSYYKQVKKTMDAFIRNEIYHKRNQVYESVRNEDEMLRAKTILDMKRVKEINSLRNETELMYRSSKLNEEKAAILRHIDSPFPDLNDRNGNESVVRRYLPPIDLKFSQNNFQKPNSALEFLYAGHMRGRLREKMQNKMIEEQSSVERYDTLNNKQIKILFFKEQQEKDLGYQQQNVTRVADESQLSHNSIEFAQNESPSNADIQSYPPLTLNALMEYRQTIQGPGNGPFDHGKPKLFKLANL